MQCQQLNQDEGDTNHYRHSRALHHRHRFRTSVFCTVSLKQLPNKSQSSGLYQAVGPIATMLFSVMFIIIDKVIILGYIIRNYSDSLVLISAPTLVLLTNQTNLFSYSRFLLQFVRPITIYLRLR